MALPSWPHDPLCHPSLSCTHSPVCLNHHTVRLFWGSPHLFTPGREGNPNQRSKFSPIHCDERGSFKGLVTGAWVTLATASSERSHSKGDDSQKWHPWSPLSSLQTAPQQLCTASITSEGGLHMHSCGHRGPRVVFLSRHLL